MQPFLPARPQRTLAFPCPCRHDLIRLFHPANRADRAALARDVRGWGFIQSCVAAFRARMAHRAASLPEKDAV